MDWLDAHRSGDIETVLKMLADNAVVECGCDGLQIITGKKGQWACWTQQEQDYPASDLEELHLSADGASISYVARNGVISPALEFNALDQIQRVCCERRSPGESADPPVAIMKDYRASIEKLRKDAAEAALVRDLATEQSKRELYQRLHEHLLRLVHEVEQAMNASRQTRQLVPAIGQATEYP